MAGTEWYAALTGDIVGSRRFAAQGPAVRDAIKDAYGAVAEAFPEALAGLPAVDVYAGDSWQMVTRTPAQALRIGLCMRALIRADARLPGVDSRLAIGIGRVDFIAEPNLSESQGEAFRLSGQALEGLKSGGGRLAVAVEGLAGGQPNGCGVETADALGTVVVLLDALCQGWTASRARAVAGALRGWTQQRIAEEAMVSQSAVAQRLAGARWTAIERAIGWWDAALPRWLSLAGSAPSS